MARAKFTGILSASRRAAALARALFACSLAAACCLPAFSQPATAQPFYEGKTITIVVGFTPGGGYDQLARFSARHLPRFLAGRPNVVVQNMPGAGSLVAATHLYNIAPRDGTMLGVVGGGTVAEPMLGNPAARYDPRRLDRKSTRLNSSHT